MEDIKIMSLKIGFESDWSGCNQYSVEKGRSTHSICGESILVCQVIVDKQSICQFSDLDIYSICCADWICKWK